MARSPVTEESVDEPEVQDINRHGEIMTMSKFIQKNKPDMDVILKGSFLSKYGSELRGSEEWAGIIESETSKRIV